jgi:hypothetical protein
MGKILSKANCGCNKEKGDVKEDILELVRNVYIKN